MINYHAEPPTLIFYICMKMLKIIMVFCIPSSMTSVFENKIIKKIIEEYRKIWVLEHAQGVLGWDMEVNMPKMGIQERSVAQGELSVLTHSFILNPKFVELVDKAGEIENLNEYEKGVVRVLKRDIRINKAFPPEFVREVSEVTSRATMAWEQARKKNDFKIFENHLDKIMVLERKAADYLGYDEYPYDALLDLYEEGLTTRDVESMFHQLEKPLAEILNRILEEGRFPRKHPLENEKYKKENMEKVNFEILKSFGFPLGERSRIDVSAHPFTTSFGVNDVRITTRYEGFDFKRALLSTVHEFGHALYELQQNPEFLFSPIMGGVSLGIHESQSRFWENIIGRSKSFVKFINPILKKSLPFMDKYDEEDLYLYLNSVRPDMIRTEASEVTYNLHIILRFKLEKIMINEGVKADELPEMWNMEMEKLMGIKPDNYNDGILQDIHWSHGTIGYFPTYSIGTIFSAQIRKYILNAIPDFYTKVENGEFGEIKEYLREKVHKYGKIYPPKELVKRSFGEGIKGEYFINYLREKYL